MSTALERLTSGYYNSGEVSEANPGGFANNGHVVNLPALVTDIGAVMSGLDAAIAAISTVEANAAIAVAARDDAIEAKDDAAASAALFTKATAAQIRAGTDDSVYITPKGQADAALPTTLAASGGVFPWNAAADGWNVALTVVGAQALGVPTNVKRGWTYKAEVTIGAGGVLSLAALNIDFMGQGEPAWSTETGKRDLLILICTDATPGAPAFIGSHVRDN